MRDFTNLAGQKTTHEDVRRNSHPSSTLASIFLSGWGHFWAYRGDAFDYRKSQNDQPL